MHWYYCQCIQKYLKKINKLSLHFQVQKNSPVIFVKENLVLKMHWCLIKKHTHVQLNLPVIYVANGLEKNDIYKDILELITVIL